MRTHFTFQNENFWNSNKSHATGGENSLPFIPFLTVSHRDLFHRLPRAGSWHGTWRLKFLRPRLCIDCWILEYSHVYTCRGTQLKCGRHCWRRRWWYSSNLHHHCCITLLPTMATFTGNSCVRRRPCIRPAREWGSAADVGAWDASRDCARDTSDEALCMCFRTPQLHLCILTCFISFLNFQDPSDPTTYPDYQVIQPPPAYVSGQTSSLPSPNRSLYTVATPPSPQTQAYRGLPIV